MKYKKIMEKLSVNNLIKRITQNFDYDSFDRLSMDKKAGYYIKYNSILAKEFKNNLGIIVNKEKNEMADYDEEVFYSGFEDAIILNGIEGNPYLNMKSILTIHLLVNELNYDDNIEIGNIAYDNNYAFSSSFFHYRKENMELIEMTNELFDTILKDNDSKYKQEYLECFDKTITQEAREDLLKVNELMEIELKKDTYEPLKNIRKEMNKLCYKDELKEKDLALFALDPIIDASINEMSLGRLINNLRKFFKTFFPEYADYVYISCNSYTLYINKDKYDDELFIDFVMQVIEKIDNKYKISSRVIGDNQYKKIKQRFPKFNKLDCYLYNALHNLDMNLKNRDLDLINYFGFVPAYYKSSSHFFNNNNDKRFIELANKKEFLDAVRNYLDGDDDNGLHEIMKYLNKAYYNFNAKLTLCNNTSGELLYGLNNDDDIYINTLDGDKASRLATLLHEFRHSIQNNEVTNNHHIYNDEAYKCIKINSYINPFGYDYNYITDYQYKNTFLCNIQPMEYDAELFAKRMITKINQHLDPEHKKMLRVNKDDFNLVDSKYINMDMISTLSYHMYMKRMKIEEDNKRDEEDYEIIKMLIDTANTEEDIFYIMQNTRFFALKDKDMIGFYKRFAKDLDIEFDVDNKELHINGICTNYKNMSAYDLIEHILLHKAIARGMDEKETLDYMRSMMKNIKPALYDVNYISAIYQYHSVFDKYVSDVTLRKKQK